MYENDPISRRQAIAAGGGLAALALVGGCSRRTASTTAVDRGALHYASLEDIAAMLQAREVSPLELTEMMLQRIELVDGTLKSYATVTAERALQAAGKAEQEIAAGRYRGPLHGVPIAVKDLCYTRGVPTMGGMAVLADFVPDYDATAVARLESAGAVLLGKLNLTEGALLGYHRDFDIPVNPWNADYWAGASSSGSGVATAAGLCFASLGTDTGGSIRYPSMANGIVGLKPTYGRVSRHGVLPLGESLDHVGPMTRRSLDAAIVFEAIAGHDANDATSLPDPVPQMLAGIDAGIESLRIGFDRAWASAGTDARVVAAVDQVIATLSGLGADIVDIRMPDYPAEFFLDTWFPICGYEAYRAHAATFPARADEYGHFLRGFLERGATVSADQYAAANEARSKFNRQFEAVLRSVHAVVSPAGGVTLPIDADSLYGSGADFGAALGALQRHFIIPADFAGTPTLTVPCGFADEGIPLGVQFMGPKLSEPMLCRIGHAYEGATEWHMRHPSI
ncbi:MAG: amidase [Woeseiaceae bacterium]|nr:amidase [Woeseiaceae bacterium]